MPTFEMMQRAYIIRSRVQSIDRCMLVRPYSPALFNQGTLPGPDLLLQRQRGNLTATAVKQKWKVVEEKEATNQSDGWPWNMQLPCRGCSDAQKRLEEVRHPLSAFACRDAGYQKAWADISRGQHLLCSN